MRVCFILAIDVDPEKWNDMFGCGVENVEKDVQRSVLNNIQMLDSIEQSGATVGVVY
jgi:hypothetical protein